MNERKLGLLIDALADYREGVEDSDPFQGRKAILSDVNALSRKFSADLAKIKAGWRKFYVWYADSNAFGDPFAISGIVWVKSDSAYDAVKRLCALRQVELDDNAEFGGLDLTEGTLLAENEQEVK